MYRKKDILIKSEIEHFVEDDSPVIAKTKSSFRVATYNILSSRLYDPMGRNYNPQKDFRLSWNFRKNIIIESIKKLGIDILALQEVRMDQLIFICQNLPEYGVMAYSEHTGKSWEEINTMHLSPDDVREIVPILYRKDSFKLLNSKMWFLSSTPSEVSTAPGTSRPRILVAGAFECFKDGTTIIISNTHYDHQNNTESLRSAGHWEAQYIEEYQRTFDAYDTIYLGDRNSFVDEACDGNQWYSQFKQESKAEDTREVAMHFGAATTFMGYEDDKFKASIDPESGSFKPKVLDLIFYKGHGAVTKSLNSLVEYDTKPDDESTSPTEKQQVSLCSFFSKPKKPISRLFASDHSCLMADIEHETKRDTNEVPSSSCLPADHGTKLRSGFIHRWPFNKTSTRPNAFGFSEIPTESRFQAFLKS